MSNALHTWYSLRDLEALGEREAILRGEIGLRRLPRLGSLLFTDEGSVRASLTFRQRGGWVIIELEHEATLVLVCQRCLEPLRHRVSERVDMVLTETSAGEGLPEGCEPLALEGDRMKPAELIEDELIVSLPLVPRHGRPQECGAAARQLAGSAGGGKAETGGCAPPTDY